MKKIILGLCLSCLSLAAFSQAGVGTELAFGIDGGFPVGKFVVRANPGVGGDVKLGYNFTPQWALLLQAGYMTFFTTEKLADRNVGAIGDGFFKVCGRYTTKGRIYLEPAVGFSKFSSSRTNDIGGDGLTLAGSIGIYADKAKTFDVSIRYEATTNKEAIHFVGLRVGYRLVSGRSF